MERLELCASIIIVILIISVWCLIIFMPDLWEFKANAELIDLEPFATTDYRTISEYVYLTFDNGWVIKQVEIGDISLVVNILSINIGLLKITKWRLKKNYENHRNYAHVE